VIKEDILEFKNALDLSKRDKKNAIRSKEFLERSMKGKDLLTVGKFFGIWYIDNSHPTDKWHRISCTLITQIADKKATGINLLYMDPVMCTRVLENYLVGNPVSYSENFFLEKEFSLEKVRAAFEVPKHSLGFIPWIDRKALGIFGTRGLIADLPKDIKRKRKRRVIQMPTVDTVNLLQKFFDESEMEQQLENEV
jgi:hypothetical protein